MAYSLGPGLWVHLTVNSWFVGVQFGLSKRQIDYQHHCFYYFDLVNPVKTHHLEKWNAISCENITDYYIFRIYLPINTGFYTCCEHTLERLS